MWSKITLTYQRSVAVSSNFWGVLCSWGVWREGGGVTVSPPLGRRPDKFWLFYILNSSNKTSLSWLMNGHLFIFTLINFYTLRVSLGVWVWDLKLVSQLQNGSGCDTEDITILSKRFLKPLQKQQYLGFTRATWAYRVNKDSKANH